MLSDFRTLQYYIAAAPVNPENMDDYYTEGWAALRQCALDGQHILNCGADMTVPQSNGNPAEQAKAELKQSVYSSPSPAPHQRNHLPSTETSDGQRASHALDASYAG